MRRIVGIGAGGHAAILVEIARTAGYEVAELTDSNEARWGTQVLGVPVVGGDERLPSLMGDGVDAAFIGVGAVRSTAPRVGAYEAAMLLGFELVSLTHPSAVVSASARLGRGVMVLPRAVIHTRADVGDNVTVYTAAVIEHDCVVEDHVHISPGVLLAGGVTIERGAFLGIGATVIHGVRIGAESVVGAGAVVVDDVPAGATVTGVPAR